jgi:hypothetical protein
MAIHPIFSKDYIKERLDLFAANGETAQFHGELSGVLRTDFVELVYSAHTFFLANFPHGAVSQREITRIFKLVPYFWRLGEKDGRANMVLRRCIYSAIALVYVDTYDHLLMCHLFTITCCIPTCVYMSRRLCALSVLLEA